MQTRIILAILAVATISIPAIADARPMTGHIPAIDIAAQPAYPMASQPSLVASHSAKRTGRRHQAAEARRAPPEPRQGQIGSGIVRSAKTGATAHVSPKFQPIAQAVVDDLEARGAVIRFMGGYRKGPCWAGGLHPCGLAIDLCQLRRGIVDPRCKLPSRSLEASVAAAHGAMSGGIWCNQDRGHIQLGQTAGACGRNLYAAVGEFQARSKQ